MLCACSPLFKDMLTRQPPSPRRPDLQPVVFLKDVSPVHFERLLQFMYCGKVQVPNNELEDLLATATSLRIHGLAQPPPSLVGRSSPPPPPAEPPLTPKPAAPPKKRRLSRDNNHIIHSSSGKNEFNLHNHFSMAKKSPLSTLDSNQLFNTSMHVTSASHSHSPPPLRNLLHNPINSITRGEF